MSRASLARLSRRQIAIGIRREDPTRIWERRCPLTPDAVHELIAHDGVQVHVEHCDRRIFPDQEFVKAGANIVPDLRAAHILLGIKEPPLPDLHLSALNDVQRTYMMFSHTAKGQPYNMPLLSSFVHPTTPRPRLIDFELLTDDQGKRTVGFGWFAGFAGVFESLASMAQSHLYNGIASPFLYTPRPHTQPSMDHLRAALRAIGARIAADGTPKTLGPFVIGVTGTGKVANGCLAALSELPIQSVSVKDLPTLVNDKDADLRKIYLVHAKAPDYLSNSNNAYSREDYYANPDAYSSSFSETVAPYLTLFLNGAGWAPGYPRLMTKEHLPQALKRAQALPGARFTNIGDISCDPEGGLEFMTHSTTLSSPSFTIQPSPELPAVRIMSVDILPSSMPLDASRHFSNALMPYLKAVVNGYTGESAGKHDAALDRATIAINGQLTEKHEWLLRTPEERRKHVLILGSGMVAGPAVDRIAQRKDVQVTIASNSLEELEALSGPHENVAYVQADLGNPENIVETLKSADVVISLLPVSLHVKVAELCVEHHKHLVTASYISDEMKALHSRATDAGVILLNEIGLDPGIDHLSAITMIEQLKAQGKDILSFVSFCGGLPDFSVKLTHPAKYKFSWNPRGGLAAFMNPARYLMGGEVREVQAGGLGKGYFPVVPVNMKEKEGILEGYPNRDSLKYIDEYGLDRGVLRSFIRGTLRFRGFCGLMEDARQQELLDGKPLEPAGTWKDVPRTFFTNLTKTAFWTPTLPTRPPPGSSSALDYFASILANDPELKYAPGERDMVVLSHEITTRALDGEGEGEEVHTAVLYMAGDEKYSAMAKTVGLPVAMAALLVLDGGVALRGVMGPGHESIRIPVLKGLEESGIVMEERTVSGDQVEVMRKKMRITSVGCIPQE